MSTTLVEQRVSLKTDGHWFCTIRWQKWQNSSEETCFALYPPCTARGTLTYKRCIGLQTPYKQIFRKYINVSCPSIDISPSPPTPYDITFSILKFGHVFLNIFSTVPYSGCDGLRFTSLTCSFCMSVHSLGSSIDCISAKQSLHYYDRQLAQLHRHILQTTCIERAERAKRTVPSAILHSTSTLALPNTTGSVMHC